MTVAKPEWPFVEDPIIIGSGPLETPSSGPTISPASDPTLRPGQSESTFSPVASVAPSELAQAGTMESILPEPSTVAGSFKAYATERGLNPADADALLALEASVPAGMTFTRDMALHEFPLDIQIEAEKAFKVAVERLPLSVQAHLEQRGLQYHPRIFAKLVAEGLALQDLDEQIAQEQTRDPHGTRLKDLLVKRYGGQAKEAIYF